MSHVSTQSPPSSPPFAVVWPDDPLMAAPCPPPPANRPTLEWPLSRLYRDWLLPSVRLQPARNRRPASPKTIEQDRNALVHWTRITSDPPLWTVVDALLDEFVRRVQEEPGPRKTICGQNTAKKICTHLAWMLQQAGPPTPRHPKALRLFVDAVRWPIGYPLMPTPPACGRTGSNWFDKQELARIWNRLQDAPDSRNFGDIPGSVVWPTIGHLSYQVGLRIDTIMQLEWGMIGCPCGCRSPADFVHVPSRIFKRGQARPPFCLNRHAREQLKRMREAQRAAGLVPEGRAHIIPWRSLGRDTIERSWPRGRGWLFVAFRKLLKAAAIDPRRVEFNGFRAALLTWAETVNPGLAPLIAGHRAGVVTVDHYTHFTAVRDLLAQVPQPGALVQKELFAD